MRAAQNQRIVSNSLLRNFTTGTLPESSAPIHNPKETVTNLVDWMKIAAGATSESATHRSQVARRALPITKQ
jgi:hypothetical protein